MATSLRTTVLLAILLRRRRKKRGRRVWVRSIFARRRQQGEFHNLLQEMRLSDPDSHFMYMRMSKERFDMLLSKVTINFSLAKVFINKTVSRLGLC